MINLDSILKSRDITLPTKVHLVKAMAFPVVMYGCESWTIKKAEQWRIDAFELWCWRRLLRVPWTARRSNQSILKEISPEYSLEGLILKLKLQYFVHLMQRTDSLEKTLMVGKTEGRRKKGRQRVRCLDGITKLTDTSLSNPQKLVMNRETWCAAVHEVTKSRTWLSDWTELYSLSLTWAKVLPTVGSTPRTERNRHGEMQRLLYWHHTVGKAFIGTLKINKQKILQAHPKRTQRLFTHRPKLKKPPLFFSPFFSLSYFPIFLYFLLIYSAFMLCFSLSFNFL